MRKYGLIVEIQNIIIMIIFGGDCTNFVSQCIYAGSNIMNFDRINGWYYINANEKSPSWTGVNFLYKFLIDNKGLGPFGKEENINNINIGDVAQLSFDGINFAHTLIIVNIDNIKDYNNIFTASHTMDSYSRKISSYNFKKIRFVHIEGVRK